MDKNNLEIKKKFSLYIKEITQQYLLLSVGLILIVISWFAYSDIQFRENINAFYTRIIPLGLSFFILVYQLITRSKVNVLKFHLYNILIASALVMMFAKYLVYIHVDGAGHSVSGIILVLFLISLELKTELLAALVVFFVPTIIFTILIFTIDNIPEAKIVNLTNVYPMVILGFSMNRIQYNLRFKLFWSNYLLNKEKQTTKSLYEETKVNNEDLQQKNEEIEVQKQAIEEKNALLENMNATKDQFFSIISHDLKSAFNAMIGFSHLLGKNFKTLDHQQQEKYITNINKSINSSYKLLENLLMWAQSQQNNAQLKKQNENLYLIIEEIIEVLQQQANNKNITIENTVFDDVIIYTEKNALKTILRNLISNAIKFTPTNGTIIIQHCIIEQINSLAAHKISIADDGIGMNETQLSKLFKISEKVSTLGTEKETGTGLGLILCKEFVDKLGGKIWAESTIQKGSKFYITIPSI